MLRPMPDSGFPCAISLIASIAVGNEYFQIWHENSHSPSSVDNLVNKYLLSAKDGANGVCVHQTAYFLGIRTVLKEPQVIVALKWVLSFPAYS